jgi:hypothetical protein
LNFLDKLFSFFLTNYNPTKSKTKERKKTNLFCVEEIKERRRRRRRNKQHNTSRRQTKQYST